MRYKDKTKKTRVALRLMVGLTTSLFFLSSTNALNAEDFTSHEGRFWNAEPVSCGAILENGYYKLTGHLTCPNKPAILITGPAKLNLNGKTLSGVDKKNVCIQIEGDGARVWNGTVTNCKDGILIDNSNRNKVIGVKACNNDRRGFKIDGTDSDYEGNENMLDKCLATDNGRQGISIEEGDGNVVEKCSATDNGQQGFSIEEGDGNKICHSKAIANCRDGIEIDAGRDNLIIDNFVEDNGNIETCDYFGDPYDSADDYYYKPWYYAGIDVTDNSEDNEIKYNRACGNLGCVPCYDELLEPTCKARERNFWDENVDEDGDCVSTNVWKNNRVVCKNVTPECSPEPED